MHLKLIRSLVGTVLTLMAMAACAQDQNPCFDAAPPSVWVVKTPFPFQNGSERTFSELYHGPWKAQTDLVLYARPRSRHVVGTINGGTVVEALMGESIVVHPLRFVAAKDFRVVKSSRIPPVQLATVHRGDVFWVLDITGEGGFGIWWHCSVVGWDSTEPGDVDTNGLDLLGKNEERWVEVRNRKTGVCGWTKKYDRLEPAHPTTKAIG